MQYTDDVNGCEHGSHISLSYPEEFEWLWKVFQEGKQAVWVWQKCGKMLFGSGQGLQFVFPEMRSSFVLRQLVMIANNSSI